MMTADLDRAHPALGTIVDLERLLVRERDAARVLDTNALVAISEQKQAMAAELRSLLAQAPCSPAVRAAVARLGALAEANAALLSDAVAMMSESLGLREDSGTYDARARRQASTRARTGQAA